MDERKGDREVGGGGRSGDPTCAEKHLDLALASLALFLWRAAECVFIGVEVYLNIIRYILLPCMLPWLWTGIPWIYIGQ